MAALLRRQYMLLWGRIRMGGCRFWRSSPLLKLSRSSGLVSIVEILERRPVLGRKVRECSTTLDKRRAGNNTGGTGQDTGYKPGKSWDQSSAAHAWLLFPAYFGTVCRYTVDNAAAASL